MVYIFIMDRRRSVPRILTDTTRIILFNVPAMILGIIGLIV